MNTTDILRLLIVLLALTAPVLIVVLNHHKRHKLGWGDVLTRIGLGAVFLSMAYGTAEGYTLGLPPGPRLWVAFGALVWVNVGLLVSIQTDRRCIKEEYEAALKAQVYREQSGVQNDVEQGST